MSFSSETIIQVLDKVEQYAAVAHEWTNVHQQILTLGLGSVVLLYNGRLGCSILLFNCVRSVGLPVLQRSLSELYASYQSAKRAFKEEGPALQKALSSIKDLTGEVRQLEGAVRELQAMASPDAEKIKKHMETIKSTIEKISSASSNAAEVGKRINGKFDMASFRKCLGDLYLVALSGFASASSSTVANLSIGLSIGNSITHNLTSLVDRYQDKIVAESKKVDAKLELDDKNIAASIGAALLDPEKLPGQLRTASSVLGHAVGLSVSMYLTSPARMFAAVTLGTDIVVSALQGLLDPVLAKRGYPTVKTHAVLLTSTLCGLGVAYNVYMYLPGASAGVIGELLLAPLLLVESVACLLVGRVVVAGASGQK